MMKIGMQTKKSMLSSKITKAEAKVKFQMDAVAILGFQVNAMKWAIIIRV
jgi:hypothetical protein